jgi:hypothetical protein
MTDRVINFIPAFATSRFGDVRIRGDETPSGTEYVISIYGTWVREDDFEAVTNKQIPVCCGNKWAKPINGGAYPAGTTPPDPIIIKDPEVVEPVKTSNVAFEKDQPRVKNMRPT